MMHKICTVTLYNNIQLDMIYIYHTAVGVICRQIRYEF